VFALIRAQPATVLWVAVLAAVAAVGVAGLHQHGLHQQQPAGPETTVAPAIVVRPVPKPLPAQRAEEPQQRRKPPSPTKR
jgi:hypothetical protein